MRNYAEIDIDYEQFPIADLSLDLHWIQLPTAVLIERRNAEREAREKERAAALPETIKSSSFRLTPLTPRSKTNSGPSSTEPPEVFAKVDPPLIAFSKTRRPRPDSQPERSNSNTNPAILLKTNVYSSQVSQVRRPAG